MHFLASGTENVFEISQSRATVTWSNSFKLAAVLRCLFHVDVFSLCCLFFGFFPCVMQRKRCSLIVNFYDFNILC